MEQKGLKTALESSEVRRQTEALPKITAKKSDDLFAADLVDQPSLFAPADNSCKGNALAVNSEPNIEEVPGSGLVERKPGRPKGAKNKSTKEWVDYFLSTVKESPLIFLGKLYAQETTLLAKKMNCDREDALKLQISAANAVLPYIHQKQPIAIETGGDELPTIQIFASPTVYQQINNGSNQVKKEIIVDGIASTTAEEISLKNNDLMIEAKTEFEE